MKIELTDAKYLIIQLNKIENGEPIIRRQGEDYAEMQNLPLNYCTECDSQIDDIWNDGHIMIGDWKNPIIAICCEGYHPLEK